MERMIEFQRRGATRLRLIAGMALLGSLLLLLLAACDNPVDILAEVQRDVMLANDRFLEVTNTEVPLISGTSDFSPTGRISITFDRALDPASLTNETIQAIDDSGLPCEWDEAGIEYAVGSTLLKVRFLPFLKVDTDYSIRFEGLRGADGSSLADPFVLNLKTGLVTTGSIVVEGLNIYPEYTNFMNSTSLDVELQITDAFPYVKYSISLKVGETETLQTSSAWVPRGSGEFPVPIDTGGEGEYTLIARFWGNTVAAETGASAGVDSSVSFIVDTTAPIVAAGSDLFANAQRTLTPSVTETYARLVAWSVTSGSGAIIYSPNTVSTAVAGSAEGNKVLRLQVTDYAGNVGYDEVGFYWDTVAPVFDLGENVYANATKNFAPSISDSGCGPDVYAWTSDGLSISAPTASSTNVSAASDSKHTLTLRVTDKAGNARSDSLTFYWDTVNPPVPSVPDLAAADDTGWSSTDNLTRFASGQTFSGTAEPYSSVQVRSASTVYATATTSSGGTWSIDAAIPGSASPYTLYALAIDRAGNQSAASGSIALSVDTVLPPVPSVPALADADDSGFSSSDNITSQASALTFSGSGAADGTRLYLNNGSDLAYSANAVAWSMDIGLSQGSHSIRAIAEDGAGNRSASASSLAVTIDATKPVISSFVIGHANPAATNLPNVTLYISASDAASGLQEVRYGNEGLPWATVEPYATSKAWTLEDKAGSKTVWIQVFDKAGNYALLSDAILLNARIVVTYGSLLITDDGDPDSPFVDAGEIYYSFYIDGTLKLYRAEADRISVDSPRAINQPQLLESGALPAYTIYEDPGTGAFTLSGTVSDDDTPLSSDEVGTMSAITYSAPFADIPSANRPISGGVDGTMYYYIDFQNP